MPRIGLGPSWKRIPKDRSVEQYRADIDKAYQFLRSQQSEIRFLRKLILGVLSLLAASLPLLLKHLH